MYLSLPQHNNVMTWSWWWRRIQLLFNIDTKCVQVYIKTKCWSEQANYSIITDLSLLLSRNRPTDRPADAVSAWPVSLWCMSQHSWSQIKLSHWYIHILMHLRQSERNIYLMIKRKIKTKSPWLHSRPDTFHLPSAAIANSHPPVTPATPHQSNWFQCNPKQWIKNRLLSLRTLNRWWWFGGHHRHLMGDQSRDERTLIYGNADTGFGHGLA